MNQNSISLESLIELTKFASTTIQTGDGREVKVIDAIDFIKGIGDLIMNEPKNMYADIVGLTLEEAEAYFERTINNKGVRMNPVSSVVVLFEGGRATAELYDRASNLRGAIGMLTGAGLLSSGELSVSTIEGKITEIVSYER